MFVRIKQPIPLSESEIMINTDYISLIKLNLNHSQKCYSIDILMDDKSIQCVRYNDVKSCVESYLELQKGLHGITLV